MTKEQLLAKAAEYAAIFSAPVFVPEGSKSTGKVSDDTIAGSVGQILEPGRYLILGTDSSANVSKESSSNTIRWNAIDAEGTPCAVYGGTLTKGTALKSAAKAGLLTTYGKQKELLIGKALVVSSIERGELDANNRRPIKKFDYTVEEF